MGDKIEGIIYHKTGINDSWQEIKSTKNFSATIDNAELKVWNHPVNISVDDGYVTKNAAYDIWKTANNMKKENKNMKILDIYKKRQTEFIQESFDVTKEDLIMQDPFTKLYEKFQTDMKKLYKKENNEELKYNFILGENFLTKETKEAILKADEEKVFKLENLDEMLEEVTALLEMTDDYDKQIEILKKYDILNEEGMLNA